MSDTHNQSPVVDAEASAQHDESRSAETVTSTVARLLANPRRIRRR